MKRGWLILGMAVCGLALPARADDGRPAPEITLRLQKTYASFSSLYAHSFSLAGGWMFEPSRAWQELALRGKDGDGLQAGAVFYLTPRIGIGLELNVSVIGLGGRNTPLRAHLEYPAVTGPEYIPHTVILEESRPWPETRGDLGIFQILPIVRLRFPVRKKTTIALAAGAGPARLSGRFLALGYSSYWLGGHSVLFSRDFLLRMRTPAVWTFGWTVELEYGLRLGPRLDIVFQAAGRGTGRISAIPEIDALLDGLSLEQTDAPGAPGLTFAPLVLEPLYLGLGLGLRVRLGRGPES